VDPACGSSRGWPWWQNLSPATTSAKEIEEIDLVVLLNDGGGIEFAVNKLSVELDADRLRMLNPVEG
jgi:hypothetical protein